jgi:hypothetical protein
MNVYSRNEQHAAYYNRGDLCRLLSAYGLRPDLTLNGRTPLWLAFRDAGPLSPFKSDRHLSIDTLRYLFEISSGIDDFDTRRWGELRLSISASTRITNWFWDYITSNFSGSELLTLQIMIFRDIIQNIENDILWDDIDTTLRTLAPKMAKSTLLLDEILMGNIDTLANLWRGSLYKEAESHEPGSRYIALLRSLGVDFQRSIEAELERLPGRIVQGMSINRKILFYQNDEHAWVLRWEWILDEEAGYLLLSEFPSMTFDGTRYSYDPDWPFFSFHWSLPRADRYQLGPKWDARRARRLAKTARKELARTGQKRPRSRMPGAWV